MVYSSRPGRRMVLIHITDLSWGRVAHPNEIVQLDEKNQRGYS